jgi:hypothetical protein
VDRKKCSYQRKRGGEIRQKGGVGKKDMIKHNKIWEKGDKSKRKILE